jgi:hypothetical protein
MRDLTGNATRAFVDISLMQVPAYQVNSGRDQASKATAGVKSSLIARVDEVNKKVSSGQAATTQVDSQVAGKTSGSKASQAAAAPAPGLLPTLDEIPIKPFKR